jgi:hypothetical protein
LFRPNGLTLRMRQPLPNRPTRSNSSTSVHKQLFNFIRSALTDYRLNVGKHLPYTKCLDKSSP